MNGSLRATVLTPAGGGAIAVIRLAGDNPRSILDRCFRPGRSAPVSTMDANRLRYGAFVAGDEVLDDVLVCVHEVNRVAVVDITAHGGLRVVGRILETMESLGARIEDGVDDASAAWPATNEIEREALRALARTTTVRAARFAAHQRAHLPGAIRRAAIEAKADRARGVAAMSDLLEGYDRAQVLLHGATVAIIGPANSGKSTLFNRLVGREAVLVSPHRGTTRDWVREPIEMQGAPVDLIDTAGAHPRADALERLAVEAGGSIGRAATIRIVLLDGGATLPDEGVRLLQDHADDPRTVVVINKNDVPQRCELPVGEQAVRRWLCDAIRLSAVNGDGIAHLQHVLVNLLGLADWDECRPAFFTGRQHGIASDILSTPPVAGVDDPRFERLLAGASRGEPDS